MNMILKRYFKHLSVFLVLLHHLFILPTFAQEIPSEVQDSIYRLAINKREFVNLDDPSVNADGQWIAYSVKKRVDVSTESERFLLDGTPSFMAGSRIYISNREGDQIHPILQVKGDSWRPVWSPNGKQLAFYSNASGKCCLWIYDLASGLSKQLCDLPINTYYFTDDKPVWNGEGTEIYVPLALSNQLQSKFSFFKMKSDPPAPNQNGAIVKTFNAPSEDPSIAEQEMLRWLMSSLAAIDVRTGSARIIVSDEVDPAPSYMKLSSTGKWLSYTTHLKPMDHPGKMSVDIVISSTQGENNRLIPVAKDLVSEIGKNYIWHPTKDILVYTNNKKIHLVELDEKGIKQDVVLFKDSPIEFLDKPLLFTRDGKFLIIGGKPYHAAYQDHPASIFIIPLTENHEPIEIQFKSPWKYLSVIHAGESQAWQQREDEIAVILEKESTGETAIAKFSIKYSTTTDQGDFVWQGTAKLTSYPAKNNVDVIYWIYEDLTTPPNIYRTGSDFSTFHRISDIEPRLSQVTPPIKKVFETAVPSYDGQLKKVRTTVLLPQNYHSENPPPGIVLFYPGSNISKLVKEFGGGDAAALPNFLLLHEGYALILPDIPLKPDGEVSHRIQEMINALLPQVYHAVNLNYVDPNRLGITGHSYGGYATAAVITQTQLFRAAVANAGVYDLAGAYGYFDDHASFFHMQWAEHGQGGMGKPLWDNPQHYLENSPYYLANKIHTPLLLIHGEDDLTCPVIEARKMFTALKRLNRKVELAIYPKQGHVMPEWTQASTLDGTMRVISFFNHYLLDDE